MVRYFVFSILFVFTVNTTFAQIEFLTDDWSEVNKDHPATKWYDANKDKSNPATCELLRFTIDELPELKKLNLASYSKVKFFVIDPMDFCKDKSKMKEFIPYLKKLTGLKYVIFNAQDGYLFGDEDTETHTGCELSSADESLWKKDVLKYSFDEFEARMHAVNLWVTKMMNKYWGDNMQKALPKVKLYSNFWTGG